VNSSILPEIACRLVHLLLFIAAGAAIGIAAMEIDCRFVHSCGMKALGWWVIPMMLFWLICIIVTAIMIVSDHSLLNIIVTPGPSALGMGFGSAALFLSGPLWASWRIKTDGGVFHERNGCNQKAKER